MIDRRSILSSLLLISLAASQLPNPSRYRVTLTLNGTVDEHYGYDSPLGKMSRMSFSNSTDERYGGIQYIYMGNINTTYTFNFMTYPSQCFARKGGPSDDMNYWLNTINLFGGANKTYDEIYFDRDCLGGCLTWYNEYNTTSTQYTVRSRLYVKKADSTPIKLVRRFYQINTQNLISTDLIEYIHWNTESIVYQEFDYPMDIQKCSSLEHVDFLS